MSRSLIALSLASIAFVPACIIVIDKTGGSGEGETPPTSGGGSTEPYPGDDTADIDCTDVEFASVLVHTVDPSGAPVRATSVMWGTGTEESPVPAECVDEACTTVIAGWEVSGDITVYGYMSADTEDPCCWLTDDEWVEVSVPVTEDGCHVVTQDVTLMLDPTELVCADAAGECG